MALWTFAWRMLLVTNWYWFCLLRQHGHDASVGKAIKK